VIGEGHPVTALSCNHIVRILYTKDGLDVVRNASLTAALPRRVTAFLCAALI